MGRDKVLQEDIPTAKKKSASYGKTIRKAVPRDVLSSWTPLSNRRESTSLAKNAFDRFCAEVTTMADDLSHMPNTGIEVQLCGNAQMANFGIVATSAKKASFDMLGFDETCRGPWEWDVARLCASIEICGRVYGFSGSARRSAVRLAARAYREAMREFANMGTVRMWQASLDVQDLFGKKAVRHAQRRFGKRIAALMRKGEGQEAMLDLRKSYPDMWEGYCSSLSSKAASVLGSYSMLGAVPVANDKGLEEFVVLLEGSSKDDVLALRVKEAVESALYRYVAKPSDVNHAQRVVSGQRVLQAKEDMFLGWASCVAPDGTQRDFYARQLDATAGLSWLKSGDAKMLCKFCKACGWTLAHAHARTGNRHAIAAYLGRSSVFETAMCDFAKAYARQNEADYRRM